MLVTIPNKLEGTIVPIITIEITPLDYEKKAEIAKVFTNELSRITRNTEGPDCGSVPRYFSRTLCKCR